MDNTSEGRRSSSDKDGVPWSQSRRVRRSSNNLLSTTGTEGADEKGMRWGCRKEQAVKSKWDGWNGESNLTVAC